MRTAAIAGAGITPAPAGRAHAVRSRSGAVRLSAPAVVVGALAAVLTVAPSDAAEAPRATSDTGDLNRLVRSGAPGPQAPVVRSAPAAPATATVRPGDTVAAIAARYGLATSDVLAWNGLGWRSIIHPGQKLRLSAAAAPAPVATPAPRPAAAPASHEVAPGDTLGAIAQRYGTTVAALLGANGLAEGTIIYPGQTLSLVAPSSAQRFASLDATQKAHAVHIIRVGRELGVPDRGIAIALATAMVESSLRNLDHGDRDSLGLFQQRPSQGWGTPAQILDPDRSIRAFFTGTRDARGRTAAGLLDVRGWQGMPFTVAAQCVQISAFPERYGLWEQQAHRWLATL